MLGLYLHLPFCERKCYYCNFVIALRRGKNDRRRFLDALQKEIIQARDRYGSLRFETIYLGGGTPSLLSLREIEEILNCLQRRFSFSPGFEFTIEINPEDTDLEKFKGFRGLGINRGSVGAQAFQDELLETLGRAHSAQKIYQVVEDLRTAGFENLTLDLINRLPGQSLEAFEYSLTEAVRIGVKQISLYDLEVHPKTVFGEREAAGTLFLPPEPIHELMFEKANTVLNQAGLLAYEISTFARPGYESCHNLIYWRNQEYLGLGPGAFSYFEGRRYQFAPSVSRYLEKIESNDWMNEVEDSIEGEKKEMESLLTGLRLLDEGISLSKLPLIWSKIEPEVRRLKEGGLLHMTDDCLKMTTRGRFLAESVFAALACA